jgi:hypothetical protein
MHLALTKGLGPWQGVSVLAAACMLFLSPTGQAERLPSPADAPALVGTSEVTVEVRNPHLALGADAPRVALRGFPAVPLLDALLGPDWRAGDREVAFRAADGYLSTIPAAQFTRCRAWLVHARADGAAFITDNAYQGKRDVPLGPWYLVWDNIDSPDLIQLGDHDWPYQVVDVSAVASGSVDRPTSSAK